MRQGTLIIPISLCCNQTSYKPTIYSSMQIQESLFFAMYDSAESSNRQELCIRLPTRFAVLCCLWFCSSEGRIFFCKCKSIEMLQLYSTIVTFTALNMYQHPTHFETWGYVSEWVNEREGLCDLLLLANTIPMNSEHPLKLKSKSISSQYSWSVCQVWWS